MEGLEKITAKILDDARLACEAQREEARAEALAIEEKGKADAEARVAVIRERGVREAEAHRVRLAGSAALQARLDTLSAKQEMIARAFELAGKKLNGLQADTLTSLLARLAAEGAKTGQEELVLSPADHTRYGKKVIEQANAALQSAGKTGQLTLSAHPRPLPGGLMLKRGEVEVNCTFAALLRDVRTTLTTEVAEILFGQA